MNPILLVGAGGHARACIDVIEQEANFSIKGLVGLPHEVGSSILEYPVLGADEDLPVLISDCVNVLVAIGQIKTPEPRIRVFDFLSQNQLMQFLIHLIAYNLQVLWLNPLLRALSSMLLPALFYIRHG